MHSHYGGAYKRNNGAWVKAMYDVGFKGTVAYEGCTPTYLPNGELVPIETMDERVQMGRDFMKQLFEKHKPKK